MLTARFQFIAVISAVILSITQVVLADAALIGTRELHISAACRSDMNTYYTPGQNAGGQNVSGQNAKNCQVQQSDQVTFDL